MKTRHSHLNSRIRLLTAALLAIGATARSADPPALKDAYKDHFYVGVAIGRTVARGVATTNRTMDQLTKDIALVRKQFNQISPENDLKWGQIQPREGPNGYNFAPADAYVNFGLSNNMYIVGHSLVWAYQTPGWVSAGTNLQPGMTNAPSPAAANATGTNAPGGGGRGGDRGGSSGSRASREVLLRRLHDHIATVVGRYKGKIKIWDVVDMAIADDGTNVLRDSPWMQIIGPDYIAKAFEYAHEARPDAILRYNEFYLEDSVKRRKLITLIKSLQEQHVPVMAIGSQTHVSVMGPSFEQEDEALTELETLGLPIHITELDVAGVAATTQGGMVSDADKRLADAYTGLFRAFVKHDKYVKMVTFWGVNDGVSWRAQGRPLLFDADDQPKPAFDAVIQVVTGQK